MTRPDIGSGRPTEVCPTCEQRYRQRDIEAARDLLVRVRDSGNVVAVFGRGFEMALTRWLADDMGKSDHERETLRGVVVEALQRSGNKLGLGEDWVRRAREALEL